MIEKPQVVRTGALDMQVCVPDTWTDKQVLEFAENENHCGTTGGWQIRKQGDKDLNGDDERVKCKGDISRAGYIHVMLDA